MCTLSGFHSSVVATWQQKLREIAPMCHFSHFTSIFSHRSGPHAKRCWSVEIFWKAVHTYTVQRNEAELGERSFAIFAFCVTATANCKLLTACWTTNCQLLQKSPCIARHFDAVHLYFTCTVLHLHWINKRKHLSVGLVLEWRRKHCVSRTISGDQHWLPTSFNHKRLAIFRNLRVSQKCNNQYPPTPK